jgi:hypothetical protein
VAADTVARGNVAGRDTAHYGRTSARKVTGQHVTSKTPPTKAAQHVAGGRGGKERAASLRAQQRLAPGGAAPLTRITYLTETSALLIRIT